MGRWRRSHHPAQRERRDFERLRLLANEPPGLAGGLDRCLLDRGVWPGHAVSHGYSWGLAVARIVRAPTPRTLIPEVYRRG